MPRSRPALRTPSPRPGGGAVSMVPTVLLCDRTDRQAPGLCRSIAFSVGRLVSRYRTPSRGDNPPNGGHGRGETKMKRSASLLSRAVLVALLLLSLVGGVASADPGDQGQNFDSHGPNDGAPSGWLDDDLRLPEDPGF